MPLGWEAEFDSEKSSRKTSKSATMTQDIVLFSGGVKPNHPVKAHFFVPIRAVLESKKLDT